MNEKITFETYLQQRQLSSGSINTYQQHINVFFDWLKEENSQATEITYTDLLNYVKHCGKRGFKKDYINKLMGVVRHYFNFLKYTGQIKNNPASGLFIRGRQKTIPHDLLTAEQMEEVYSNFHQKGIPGKRNRAMLGLIIYQSLDTEELELLEPIHLKLR